MAAHAVVVPIAMPQKGDGTSMTATFRTKWPVPKLIAEPRANRTPNHKPLFEWTPFSR